MNLSDDNRRFQRGDRGAGDGLGTVAHAGPAHSLTVGAVAWTVEDAMAASIVRLEQELDEANARVAVLEEEQKILAKGFPSPAKAAVIEGRTGETGAKRPEPSPQFPETQEAIERWRQGKINIFDEMARLERERNELREVMAEIVTWVEDDLRETVDAGYRAAVEKAQKLTEGLR